MSPAACKVLTVTPKVRPTTFGTSVPLGKHPDQVIPTYEPFGDLHLEPTVSLRRAHLAVGRLVERDCTTLCAVVAVLWHAAFIPTGL